LAVVAIAVVTGLVPRMNLKKFMALVEVIGLEQVVLIEIEFNCFHLLLNSFVYLLLMA
jgi:hypothetical protein